MKRSVLLVLVIMMFAVAPTVAQPTAASKQHQHWVRACRHKQEWWDFRWHLRHLL